MKPEGKVWLVGAGPGDPGLLTVTGKAVLDAANTVVHDRLVSEEILLGLPSTVKLVDVGKYPGRHPVPQEEINRILIAEARNGKKVVRLKGGDPFVFARGGEELLALRAAGISVDVVPGLSSALALPACVGIPLTHRDFSASLHVIAWRRKDGASPRREELEALFHVGGTVIILMAAGALREIRERLVEAGFAPDTPAAVIEQGATPRERMLITSLDRLGDFEAPSPPVLVVVGKVCLLAEKCHPAEKNRSTEITPGIPEVMSGMTSEAASAMSEISDVTSATPLRGIRLVVTRPEPQNGETCRRIRVLGGTAIPFHCTRTVPAEIPEESYREAGKCSWLVFTSATGVEFFFEGFLRSAGDFRSLAPCRFAAVGPATAAALAKRGFVPDYVSPVHNGRGLGEGLGKKTAAGEEILLIRAAKSAPGLPEALAERGLAFRELRIYCNVPAEGGTAARRVITEGRFDGVLFASPSAVEAFAALSLTTAEIKALCIGPTTAAAARRLGMTAYTAAETGIEGLFRLAAALFPQKDRDNS